VLVTVNGNMASAALAIPMTELRALLTEREREILKGEADVSEKYYYRVVTRVRKKIQKLDQDLQIMEENHEKLANELQEIVCNQE